MMMYGIKKKPKGIKNHPFLSVSPSLYLSLPAHYEVQITPPPPAHQSPAQQIDIRHPGVFPG